MRELLQQALYALRIARSNNADAHFNAYYAREHAKCEIYDKDALTIATAEKALEAALSRSKWNKVADGLPVVPVVPDGFRKVDIWVRTITGEIQKYTFFDGETANNFAHSFTHWQYRQDDTPAPPEDV